MSSLYEKLMFQISKIVKQTIFEEENKIIKIDKEQIKAKFIVDYNELLKIIKNSNPNKENNTGFWLFDECIKKDKNYLNIDDKPFYIQYIVYFYENTPIAMRSFSTKYYIHYNHDEKFKKFVHLFDFQVDSKYKGNNLQEYAWNHLENIVKKHGYEGFTLMCYEKSLKNKYLKNGFTGDEYLMWKKF